MIEQPNSSVLWWYGPVEDLRKPLENSIELKYMRVAIPRSPLSFEELLRRHGAFSISIPLGAYGAKSLCPRSFLGPSCFRKPVTLFTTSPLVASLGAKMDPLRRQCCFLVCGHAPQGANGQTTQESQHPAGEEIPRSAGSTEGGFLVHAGLIITNLRPAAGTYAPVAFTPWGLD